MTVEKAIRGCRRDQIKRRLAGECEKGPMKKGALRSNAVQLALSGIFIFFNRFL